VPNAIECHQAVRIVPFNKEGYVMDPIKSPPRPMPQEELVIPMHQRKTMTTLLPDDCRWPIGDPQHEDFHFCGKHKMAGHPYCEFHVRRASQPGRARTVTYMSRDAA
jgi:hypothetical protein